MFSLPLSSSIYLDTFFCLLFLSKKSIKDKEGISPTLDRDASNNRLNSMYFSHSMMLGVVSNSTFCLLVLFKYLTLSLQFFTYIWNYYD